MYCSWEMLQGNRAQPGTERVFAFLLLADGVGRAGPPPASEAAAGQKWYKKVVRKLPGKQPGEEAKTVPMKCGVCVHPQVEDINRALLAGGTLRELAGRYGVTKSSLHRHSAHLPATLVLAKQAHEVAKADTLLEQVASLQGRAMSIVTQAEQARDWRAALQGVKEARGCLELLARLQVEIARAGTAAEIAQQRREKAEASRQSQREWDDLVRHLVAPGKKGGGR